MIVSIVRLPICPSTNALFRNAGKRRIITTAYETWREEAGYALNLHRVQPFGRQPVQIEISVNEEMRGDIDNRFKAPIDLLVKHGVIEDDRFVRRASIERVAASVCRSREMLLSIMPYEAKS